VKEEERFDARREDLDYKRRLYTIWRRMGRVEQGNQWE